MAASLEAAFFDWREIWRSFDEFLEQPRHKLETESRAPTFSQFVQAPEPFLHLVFRAIERGEYRLHPAREITIFADKHRTIHQFPYPDEFVLRHFARLLSERSEHMHADSVYSFRKGRGSHMAVARTREYIKAHEPVWVVRRDVKSFGESLHHGLLMEDFETVFEPKPVLKNLFLKVCRFRIGEGDDFRRNQVGLPNGANIQLVFENLYLRDIDRELTPIPDSLYLRFGDDILFLTTEKQKRDRAIEIMNGVMASRALTFSEKKSETLLLVRPESPALDGDRKAANTHFEYLGWQIFFDGRVKLPTRKQRKMQTLLRQRLRSIAALDTEPAKRVRTMIQAVRQLISTDGPSYDASIRSYVAETSNENQLRAFDRWIALEILRIAFTTGFSKSNFRLMSYRELRRAGLPSLLHLRRTRHL